MIYQALEYLRLNISAFLKAEGMDLEDKESLIVLGNIAKLEDPAFKHKNKVLLSLVNVEEESAKKNGLHYTIEDDKVKYRNPSLNVNLYVLFTCNLDKYDMSLEALSKVMSFFQMKNIFTFSQSPVSGMEKEKYEEARKNLKLIVDLYTMTFEQLNHLWGSLGGKQQPSALYKIRLVEIQGNRTLDEVKPIERVKKELAYQE